jgi:hypothetical protein
MKEPSQREVEAMFQALVADNENRRQRGLPTFEPSYETAKKALENRHWVRCPNHRDGGATYCPRGGINQ